MIAIYASQIEAFDERELKLLDDLAEDLAFGITMHRLREAHAQSETRLRENEATLRSVFQAAPMGICLVKNRRIQIANKYWCEKFGCAEEELRNQTPRRFYESQEEYDRVGRELYSSSTARNIASVQTRQLFADGIFHDVIITTAPVLFQNPSLGSVVMIEDISERKRSEEERRRAENLLRNIEHKQAAILDAISDPAWLKDTEYRFQAVNKAWSEFFGMESHLVIGKTGEEFLPHDVAQRIQLEDQKAMQSQKPLLYEERMPDKNGRDMWFETTKSPIRGPGGKVIGTAGIAHDITERKLTEKYQVLSGEVLNILNQDTDSKEAIRKIVTTIRGQLGCEAVAIRLQHGTDFPYFIHEGFPEEFIRRENSLISGDVTEDCQEPDFENHLECTCGLVLSGKTDPANPLYTPGGSAWTNDAASACNLPGQIDQRFRPRNHCLKAGYLSVALIPIRSNQQIIGLLQLNDHKNGLFNSAMILAMESIAVHIGDAMLRLRAESLLRESQNKYHTLFENLTDAALVADATTGIILDANKQSEILLGMSRHEIIGLHQAAIAPPDQADLARRLFVEAKEKVMIPPSDLEVIRKDGTRIPVSVAGATFHIGNSPVLLGLFRNLTEIRKIQQQLLQSQKMEAVGRLAGGIAHDFRNELTIVIGYGEMLKRMLTDNEKAQKYIVEIIDAPNRSSAISNGLLAFSRQQALRPQITDIGEMIKAMSKSLSKMLGEDIHLAAESDKPLHPVMVDPVQLHQALMNMVINARDAMPNGGRIWLETKNVMLDDAYVQMHGGSHAGPHVMLVVQDTGCGMTKEVMEKIFEPFFTTKPIGQGTGLGVPMVYGFVQQSGGHLTVESEVGKGTTFRVYLPAAAGGAAETPKPVEATPLERGTETLLVVEDEKLVQTFLADNLEEHGYTVLCAANAQEALGYFEARGLDIDLMITDIVMPGMNGIDLAAEVAKLRPGLPILHMSGYAGDALTQRCQGALKTSHTGAHENRPF